VLKADRGDTPAAVGFFRGT